MRDRQTSRHKMHDVEPSQHHTASTVVCSASHTECTMLNHLNTTQPVQWYVPPVTDVKYTSLTHRWIWPSWALTQCWSGPFSSPSQHAHQLNMLLTKLHLMYLVLQSGPKVYTCHKWHILRDASLLVVCHSSRVTFLYSQHIFTFCHRTSTVTLNCCINVIKSTKRKQYCKNINYHILLTHPFIPEILKTMLYAYLSSRGPIYKKSLKKILSLA